MATAADPDAPAIPLAIPPASRKVGPWRLTHAPAKINLGLRITGRRDDGYHLLDSLVVFADVGDHVAIRETAEAPAFALRGPFAQALAGAAASDNLVVAAAAAFRQTFGGPEVDIVLWKRLPVASGIGGGSADAAASLRLLADVRDIPLRHPKLLELAFRLGADTPMCLMGRTVRVGGVGERLAPAPALPPLPAVLVNAGAPVATPAVFRARTGPFSDPGSLAAAYADVDAVAQALRRFGNDLTAPALTLAPSIRPVLIALQASAGVAFAGMSGSGGTCFALYADMPAARAAARDVRARNPQWWAVATRLNGAPD